MPLQTLSSQQPPCFFSGFRFQCAEMCAVVFNGCPRKPAVNTIANRFSEGFMMLYKKSVWLSFYKSPTGRVMRKTEAHEGNNNKLKFVNNDRHTQSLSNAQPQTETNKILFHKRSTKNNINKNKLSLIVTNSKHWEANLRYLMKILQNLRHFQGLKFGKKNETLVPRDKLCRVRLVPASTFALSHTMCIG